MPAWGSRSTPGAAAQPRDGHLAPPAPWGPHPRRGCSSQAPQHPGPHALDAVSVLGALMNKCAGMPGRGAPVRQRGSMWKLFIAGAAAGPPLPPVAPRPPQPARPVRPLRVGPGGNGAPAQRGQSNYWETGLVRLRVLLLSHPMFSVCVSPEQHVWRRGGGLI